MSTEALFDRVRQAIAEEGDDVTFAELVGGLELIKGELVAAALLPDDDEEEAES